MAICTASAVRRVRASSARVLLSSAVAASALAVSVPARLSAQTTAQPSELRATEVDACAGPASHAFDFWPGVWEIESRRLTPEGRWLETRQTWRAETVLGGCAFVDLTDGDSAGEPMKGMGTRFWDPEREEWVITWLSTEAPGELGIWRGTFDDSGRGEFFQTYETPNGTVISRISWYDIRRDSLDWDHAISRDGGETWQQTWIMRLRKVSDESR